MTARQQTDVMLDLATMMPAPASKPRLRGMWFGSLAAAGGFVSIGVLALPTQQINHALTSLGLNAAQAPATIRIPLAQVGQVDLMTVDDKAQIVVAGLAAQQRNALIPLSTLQLQPGTSFRWGDGDETSRLTALKCLTQAIYYEAAVEPLQGRRAVAQVVLNRMRHPAYPKSVCGVVYQGAERRTGCQFSFTCDGSLLRAPATRPWQEAEQIARSALAGHVEKSVGTATHYHADYVLPKWAFELAKIEQLGRHIFYRFNGVWGTARALNGRYSGIEHIPALNLLALRQRLEQSDIIGENGEMQPQLAVAPHITDRHATNDVGGRLDVTKQWRLTIPDPVQASTRYRQALDNEAVPVAAKVSTEVAVADQDTRGNP
ncbi:MAG: cell wall hydrolase [Novosphingobium sp.]